MHPARASTPTLVPRSVARRAAVTLVAVALIGLALARLGPGG